MERVKVTQEQADILFRIARMSKGIPAKVLISELENGFEIESETESRRKDV